MESKPKRQRLEVEVTSNDVTKDILGEARKIVQENRNSRIYNNYTKSPKFDDWRRSLFNKCGHGAPSKPNNH